MTSLIAWLDASSEDQRRMREIVNLFSERESRDELGIGQVRDALSDLLWPGTSTLFTRARYFLFIPWCYRAAAEARNDVDKAAALADQNERRLIRALTDAGERDGVIGANVGMALKNLPSALYWGGMRTHGILNDPTLSRDDAIVAELDRVHTRRPVTVEYEDEAAAVWHDGAFHSTLPSVPKGFPAEVPAGFAMPRSEAAWLRDRMLASSPDTMLEYALQHRPDADSAVPWEDSVLMSADGERAKVLDDARRFSDPHEQRISRVQPALGGSLRARGVRPCGESGRRHTASDSTNGLSNLAWRTTLQRGIAVHSGVACSSRIQASTSDHAASSTCGSICFAVPISPPSQTTKT